MKVVNHHKNNYTYDDTREGSVMNGTVFVTENEWQAIIKTLRSAYASAKRASNTYARDALSHVFEWVLPRHSDKKRLCLGVHATKVIFKHYKLPRYKRQNYVISRI